MASGKVEVHLTWQEIPPKAAQVSNTIFITNPYIYTSTSPFHLLQ